MKMLFYFDKDSCIVDLKMSFSHKDNLKYVANYTYRYTHIFIWLFLLHQYTLLITEVAVFLNSQGASTDLKPNRQRMIRSSIGLYFWSTASSFKLKVRKCTTLCNNEKGQHDNKNGTIPCILNYAFCVFQVTGGCTV